MRQLNVMLMAILMFSFMTPLVIAELDEGESSEEVAVEEEREMTEEEAEERERPRREKMRRRWEADTKSGSTGY